MPEDTSQVKMNEDGSAEVILSQLKIINAMAQMEHTNLAETMISEEHNVPIYKSYYSDRKITGKDCLKEMGNVCCDEYDMDKASRKDWEEASAAMFKLFTSFLDVKDDPWPGCSNICLPMLSTSVLQFQARAYEALIPPKNVASIIPTGKGSPEDSVRADRVEKYMNYQLLYEMEEFEEGMDKTLMQLPIFGSAFRKTYHDAEKKRVTSINICASDLIVNYASTDIETASRKTHVIYLDQDTLRKRVAQGIYGKEALLNQHGLPKELDDIQTIADQALGQTDTTDTFNNPVTILEMHRNWDINGDGISEPVIITVDYKMRTVLRVTPRYFFDAQGREYNAEYFTHYTFFPNPEGFYGLGFGILIRALNETANNIVNEVVDAGALANLQGGFVSKRSGLKKGPLGFKMGQFTSVDTYADDIRKAIYNFDFKGPNQTLYAVLGLLYEYSKLVSSISETMTGQLPSSDTPATTVLALLEEGRKVFSSIHKRIHRSFKKELKKVFRLDSMFLDPIKYFHCLGEKNIPNGPQMLITRLDFLETYDVIPVSDPAIMSKAEKIIKAKAFRDDIVASPLTANDSNAIYIATLKYYETLDIPNIGEILKPPQAQQDVPPEEENAGMIAERPANVLPQQDHEHHLQTHNDLINGPYAEGMTPAGRKMVDKHNQDHLGQLYLAQKRKPKLTAVQ